MFTLIPDTNYTATLTTKCVAVKNPNEDSTLVRFNGKFFYIKADTLLSQYKQLITQGEYFYFLRILEGSYYWALKDPCPNGDGMTDGDMVVLRAKSKHCMDDTLSYTQIGIHCSKGSFRDACTYLAEISKLEESHIAYYRLSGGLYKGKYKKHNKAAQ